jgi:hypothetical protein
LTSVRITGRRYHRHAGGIPQTIGQTSGAAPVAIAPWHRAENRETSYGWFIGWPRPDNRVALAFIRRGSFVSAVDPAASLGRPRDTPALDVVQSGSFSVAGATADAVRVAVGRTRVEGVDLGVTWQSTCGETPGEIWFAKARFNASGAGTFAIEQPIRLDRRGSATRPVLVWLGAGFSTIDRTRDRIGGWIVAWMESSGNERQALAVRVAEVDGRVIDDAPIALGDGAIDSLALIEGAAGDALAVWRDRSASRLVSTRVFCAPPP